MSILHRLVTRLHPEECAACYKPLRRRQGIIRSGPFGGPGDFTYCRTCKDHRATDEHHAIWTLRRWDVGAFPPSIESLDRELFLLAEADGDPATSLSPIHVVSEGRYVPVRQWVGSPAHERAIVRYVNHPAHKHLNLDPHVWNGDRKAA